ncbi:hypothetical protein HWV62_27129 [Athelia sp. TMB]|nr:hypothetical protein HWV62_27129 [Athelia sp. TMB]
MESLNTLASSLPNGSNNLANSEKELLNTFKAAALSITTLYRSSRQTSKRAYNAGYGAACQDLLLMIQQGVSVGGTANDSTSSDSTNTTGGNQMTIGKVMDWIEARLEAIKSREEEEDEDEEKERAKNSNHSTATNTTRQPVAKDGRPTEPMVSGSRVKVQVLSNLARVDSSTDPPLWQAPSVTLPLTPSSPTHAHAYAPSASSPPSPSPPATPSLTHRPIHQLPKPSKSRVTFPNTPTSDTHKFAGTSSVAPVSTEDAFGSGVGAKRRHAVMMMLDSAQSPVDVSINSDSSPTNPGSSMSIGSGSISHAGSRRRTRSTRTHGHGQQPSEAMDVEEDGRERKRTYPIPGETFIYDDSQTIELDTVPLNGGILIKVIVLSSDPYLRGRMRAPEIPSYMPAMQIGQPCVITTVPARAVDEYMSAVWITSE